MPNKSRIFAHKKNDFGCKIIVLAYLKCRKQNKQTFKNIGLNQKTFKL